MKFPKKNGKTFDMVQVGQKTFFVKDAQNNLESQFSELQTTRIDLEGAIMNHDRADSNFMNSLGQRAADIGQYEKFNRAQGVLGSASETEGSKLRQTLEPFVKEGELRMKIDSVDEEKGSKILAAGDNYQQMIDSTDAELKGQTFQNRSDTEDLNKDSPVRWQDALERGDQVEANRLQDKFIDETIQLANETAQNNAERKIKEKIDSRDAIEDELQSFGIKRFRRRE